MPVHHHYVSVLTRSSEREVRAYLYGGVIVLATLPGGRYVLEVSGETPHRAEVSALFQEDRLHSGPHRARAHRTFGDALAFLPASRNPVAYTPRRDPEADGRFAQEWAR